MTGQRFALPLLLACSALSASIPAAAGQPGSPGADSAAAAAMERLRARQAALRQTLLAAPDAAGEPQAFARRANHKRPPAGQPATSAAPGGQAPPLIDLLELSGGAGQTAVRRDARLGAGRAGAASRGIANPVGALAQLNRPGAPMAVVAGSHGGIRMLRGAFAVRNPPAPGGGFPALARQFVRENSPLFELAAGEGELLLRRSWRDSLGKRHAVFDRAVDGVPVLHEQLSVHGANGRVYLAGGRYSTLAVAAGSLRRLGADEAMAVVLSDIEAPLSRLVEPPAPERYLLRVGDAYRHIWRVEALLSNMTRWEYLIDAADGSIIEKRQNMHSQVVPASGRDALERLRRFNACRENGRFYMVDPSTPAAAASRAYDSSNCIDIEHGHITANAANADNFDRLLHFRSDSATADWDPVAVSVHANTRQTYDYYLDTFGRNGVDGEGRRDIISIAHFGNDLNNAFWIGIMVYGDGDGVVFDPLGNCLDVVAHELTHGVIEHSANLVYRNQSGALNESFADVFGAMVDREDWRIGEDCRISSPGYLRSLQAPGDGGQPAHMRDFVQLPNTKEGDWGGVHVNSGIPNRAAWLVAEGLETSIGRLKTEQIWYRALTTYLTASSEFAEARTATLQAAADLHGENSAEAATVALAWDSVGVAADSGAPEPGPGRAIESVPGEDYVAYLSPAAGARNRVYLQRIPEPFSAYDAALDLGPLNSPQFARETRLAPVTDDGGLYLFYVGGNGNVYTIRPDGGNSAFLESGNASTIAVSPDRRYFAFVTTSLKDRNIRIYDFKEKAWTAHELETPNYSRRGQPPAIALYADAIAFDHTGRRLVYDYFICQPGPREDCDPESDPSGYWSIGELQVETGRFSFPFPTQPQNFDLGFPRYASNTNRHIVFDSNDYGKFAATGLVESAILTYDKERQDVGLAGVGASEDGAQAIWALPSFSGDDDYVYHQFLHEGDTLGIRSPMRDYVWSRESPKVWNPNPVAAPTAHRHGERIVRAELRASASTLDFGSVASHRGATRSFAIRNAGNRAIEVTSVAVTGQHFSHDLTNTTLEPEASRAVEVSFLAGRIGGAVGEVLTVGHDGDNGQLLINLAAKVIGAQVSVTPVDDNGNGMTDWNEGLRVGDNIRIEASDMQLLRLYTGALGRVPDFDGFVYWRGRVAAGAGFARIGDEFFWSREMQTRMDVDGNGEVSDSEFIDHLYVNVLRRAPDRGGLDYWLGRLAAGGSAGKTMAEFLNSREYIEVSLGLIADFALDNPGLW